jgi:hypothetical protein
LRGPPTGLAVAGVVAAIFTAGTRARAGEPWLAPRLSGYIQADGALYDQASEDEVDPSTGAPLNQTRYAIRRARIHLDVDHGRMAGAMEVDFNTVNGPSAGLIDAEVTLRGRAGVGATPPSVFCERPGAGKFWSATRTGSFSSEAR